MATELNPTYGTQDANGAVAPTAQTAPPHTVPATTTTTATTTATATATAQPTATARPTATAKPAGPAPAAAKKRRSHPSLSRKNRIGLVLTFLMGLANIPSVLASNDGGGYDSPPMAVMGLDTLCGVVAVVACVIAWRKGSRDVMRLASGANILMGLTAFPAFFVDIPPAIKVLAAASVVITFISVVLTLSPGEPGAAPRR